MSYSTLLIWELRELKLLLQYLFLVLAHVVPNLISEIFSPSSGSAAANAISQFLLAVLLFVYICLKGLHKATWDGQSESSNQSHLSLCVNRLCGVEWIHR